MYSILTNKCMQSTPLSTVSVVDTELIAILSAAASAAFDGKSVRVVDVQEAAQNYYQFSSWIHFARSMQLTAAPKGR